MTDGPAAYINSGEQLALLDDQGLWHTISKSSKAARELVDRHYSRQTVGARDFLPPGRCLALFTFAGLALWGVVENLDPSGALQWRCTIFHNESSHQSSTLIVEATARTYRYWETHYHGRPHVPLRTEVDASKVRKKRDPGRCFIKAGWKVVGKTKGGHGRSSLVVLEAPP